MNKRRETCTNDEEGTLPFQKYFKIDSLSIEDTTGHHNKPFNYVTKNVKIQIMSI